MKLEKFFKLKLEAQVGPFGLKAATESKDQKYAIVDVRSQGEFQKGHIPGAINIPRAELEAKGWKALSKKDRIFVYCVDVVCQSSLKACYFLSKKGYWATEVVGGYEEWQKRFPVSTKAPKAKAEKPAPSKVEAPAPELAVA